MGIKLVIVGGVAGGATAAARARRVSEDAEIIVFERGEYISFANCGLPYYIGNVIKKRDHLLLATPAQFKQRYNIDVRIFSEVVGIDSKEKAVEIKNTTTGEKYWENYDKLILSPGAEPIKPPLEGIDLENVFHLRNVPDSDRIKKIVDERNPQCAVVVGGGFIGLEMAENLTERGVKTTIVEMLDQVMPSLDYEMAALIHDHLESKNVELELENGVKSFSKAGDQILVTTQKEREIECDLVLLSVGIRPANTLAIQADLKIGPTGGIEVDNTMKTSDPDIYAVGDAVEVRDIVSGFPTLTALAGPANKQARIAADNALGRKSIFKGTLGTSVVKVFDMVLASTGANEKFLRKHDIPYLVSYTHSGSHAGYYPGATTTSIKILFSPGTGRVLGAQIVGKKGVDKRIDVLATAIRAKMTVYDLEELELAYAPPYSSAKDPINICGFVAANILKGDMEIVQWS
jgi:NADPH-dependent 2,4-dienoyl-CoA reductase/sulfur reductase-like enzyme